MAKIKVLTVVGTRPELIRLSRLIPLLDEFTDHILVHTGQNFDPNLSDIFFEDLELRSPDYYLGIRGDSLGAVLGNLFPAIENVLMKESPDAVAILGDTNSSLVAIIAERMGIPVYHMEAGNRSFDVNVPEELNRKLVDHISTFNLSYTEFGRRNLLAEGLHPRYVMVTGSPLFEVIGHFRSKIETSSALGAHCITEGGYFVASFHREENVDNEDNLRSILDALGQLGAAWNLPVIASLHPRTANRIDRHRIEVPASVKLVPPLNFTDYCQLQRNAKCVLSDSGTISEEAAILDFPAVTVRNSMERPEALEAGVLVMSGLSPGQVLAAVETAVTSPRSQALPPDYQVPDFSIRVLKQLVSTANVSRLWSGRQNKRSSI
jgi:UDP-N-acetyl-L-fucosamine synthase